MILGFELKALHLLGRHSQALYCLSHASNPVFHFSLKCINTRVSPDVFPSHSVAQNKGICPLNVKIELKVCRKLKVEEAHVGVLSNSVHGVPAQPQQAYEY
jgi:hypothetical protein